MRPIKRINDVLPDVYRHYKGGIYRVLHVAKLEATGEDMVVYSANDIVWVRPFSEFKEKFFIITTP